MDSVCRQSLFSRGNKFLGTTYPIMGGAMTWLSERNLVSAISNAGGFGIIACGSMNSKQLGEEIEATQQMTNKPFGVNLLHPDIDDLIDCCIKKKTGLVVFAGGFPKKRQIELLKNKGIKTMCFATTLSIARKMISYGIDSLVLEGSEAGGHIGPVSINVLIQDILPEINEVPIFVAGGIGITPFISMVFQAQRNNQNITLYYCTKNREKTAYFSYLTQMLGNNLVLHE